MPAGRRRSWRAALGLVAVLLLPDGAWSARLCGQLGDRLAGRPDVDTFTVLAPPGTPVTVRIEGSGAGEVRVDRRGPRGRRRGTLPMVLSFTTGGAPATTIRVREVRPARRRFRGPYCLVVGDDAPALARASDVELPWVPLPAGSGTPFPPFLPVADGPWDGRVQPLVPLVGDRVYGLIVTRGVRDMAGRPLEADAAFRALTGSVARPRGGPVARFSADPEAAGNPYPEARLVRPDGRVRVPDRVALRGLDAADPRLAAARAELREVADGLADTRGFSTVSPIAVALSAPVDVATVTPAHVLLFERTDRGLDTAGLLREARRHGVAPGDVALAIAFPTQPIETALFAVGATLARLAESSPFGAILDDPDPADDLPIGIFDRTRPAFAPFLAATPQVDRVVAGLVRAREFRGPDGLFARDRTTGDVVPPLAPIDFLCTIPAAGVPPWPVVIFQHGFAGSNAQVLAIGALLAEHGLATIGITAVSHGRRGNPLALLTGTPFELREIFRQTVADQLALVQTIDAGLDVTGDGQPDLDAQRISYLGISLGGLIGGPLVAVEERIRAAVLNVMGGRTALNGLNRDARAIFTGTRAARLGLAVGEPAFETYLARQIELSQHVVGPADALDFARLWHDEPRPVAGAPTTRRVLVQEGLGDGLVWNVLTEELAMVAGLPTGVARQSPDGVSGHWIFPGGHGIFERADVRAQAIRFLGSDGTVLIDPAAP